MQTESVLSEVKAERDRQDAKWGPQNHPDFHYLAKQGASGDALCGLHEIPTEARARQMCDWGNHSGTLSWAHILIEEMSECVSAASENELRQELIQVAAVAVAWIEAIDRRGQARVEVPQ